MYIHTCKCIGDHNTYMMYQNLITLCLHCLIVCGATQECIAFYIYKCVITVTQIHSYVLDWECVNIGMDYWNSEIMEWWIEIF